MVVLFSLHSVSRNLEHKDHLRAAGQHSKEAILKRQKMHEYFMENIFHYL
jgi:hypothetical protein